MKQIKHSPSRVGDISEMDICLRFMKDGWEVFRNVGSSGPIDLVVVDFTTGNVMLLDSKTPTINRRKDGMTTIHAGKLTDEQKNIGVRLVAAYQDRLFIRKDKIKEEIKHEDS